MEMRDHCAACEELTEFDESARLGEKLICRECVGEVVLQAAAVLRKRPAGKLGLAVAFRGLQDREAALEEARA